MTYSEKFKKLHRKAYISTLNLDGVKIYSIFLRTEDLIPYAQGKTEQEAWKSAYLKATTLT